MNLYLIFLLISSFILGLTLVRLGKIELRAVLIGIPIMAITLAGLSFLFPLQIFKFCYYASILNIPVIIGCLTYLINRLFRRNSNKIIYWLRVSGIGAINMISIIIIFVFIRFLSFIYGGLPSREDYESPSGQYLIRAECNIDVTNSGDKNIVMLRLLDEKGRQLDYLRTGASDFSKWAVIWSNDNTVILNSSDIGTYAWSVGGSGLIEISQVNNEMINKGIEAYDLKYKR